MNWVQINIQVNEDFRYMKIHIFALRWKDEIRRSSQLIIYSAAVRGLSELKTFWGISHLPVNALIYLYFNYLFC